MSTSTNGRAPASTFLTHYFGGGLIDQGECYVVERFRAMSNGEIRRWPGKAPAKNNGRGRPKPEVASLDAVQELRPVYNEIIVCTGPRYAQRNSILGLCRMRPVRRPHEETLNVTFPMYVPPSV